MKDEKIKIESNIPYQRGSYLGSRSKWPLLQMKVGDSFQFDKKYRPGIGSQASWYKLKREMEFKIAKVSESHCRIWRMK